MKNPTSMKISIAKFISIAIIIGLMAGSALVLAQLENNDEGTSLDEPADSAEFINPVDLDEPGENTEVAEPVDPAPEAVFLNSEEGKEIKKEESIELEVKGAESVEFYLQRSGDVAPIYLGQGSEKEKEEKEEKKEEKEEKIWQLELQPTDVPNGKYELSARVNNEFGQYVSETVKIKIEVEAPVDIDQEEIIEAQVGQAAEAIGSADDAIGQAQDEAVESGVEDSAAEEFVEFVAAEQQLQQQIAETQEEEVQIEEQIAVVAQEIAQLPEAPIEPVKEDKEAILKSYQAEMVEVERSASAYNAQLNETVEEKEKIKDEIIAAAGPSEAAGELRDGLQNLELAVAQNEKIKIESKEILTKDPDQDGLNNQEEIRIGTLSTNPDTDRDGFLDGIEVQAGYDPLKPGPADKIIYQDPTKVAPKKADVYKVERVEKTILPSGEAGIKLEGKALPNSFATLYIFSSLPLIVIVSADKDGNWEYLLDKPLADGEHKVYTAVTNNRGQIEARSEVFVFIKAGEKVFRIFQSPGAALVSPAQNLQKSFAFLVISIVVFAFGAALTIIGIITRKKLEKAKV